MTGGMKTVTLYRHQKDGVDKGRNILDERGGLGIFFDPGLGKSLTALTLADDLFERQEIQWVVIVCPKTLYGTWQDQIANHTYHNPAFEYLGTKVGQKRYDEDMAKAELSSPFILVNYESWREMKKPLADLMDRITSNSMLVMDESTRIKTPSSQQSKGLRKVAKAFRYRIIMTGTEITKSPLDLWAQFEALRPNFWSMPWTMFKKRYGIWDDMYLAGGNVIKRLTGFQNIHALQKQVDPWIVRAKKEDCMDLPDKIFQNIPVELDAKEWKAYRDMKDRLMTILDSGEMISVEQKIALFTRFRTITGGWADTQNKITDIPSKLSTLIDMIEDSDGQAIIWCSFTHEIYMIQKELSEHGKCVTYHGPDNQEERVRNFNEFTSGRARFFVANPQTAGFGLNLQNCPLQYFYSLPTSAETFLQALDRSHRIGTTTNVVYRFLLGVRGRENCIDWRIKELLDQSVDLLHAFQTRELRELVRFV